LGRFDVDLAGGGTRLQPGDQLGVLVYGLQDQYARNGVTGSVSLPIFHASLPSI